MTKEERQRYCEERKEQRKAKAQKYKKARRERTGESKTQEGGAQRSVEDS